MGGAGEVQALEGAVWELGSGDESADFSALTGTDVKHGSR